MRREDLAELHYISPIKNIRSIMRLGILSHRQAEHVQHESIAMEVIQERRRGKRVPGARRLHEYVNLYVCARNPMLFRRKEDHKELCVLRIDPGVLNRPGTIVSDRNASSEYARFDPVPVGLANLDGEIVFAEYWTYPDDQREAWRRKSMKCAEILVPDRVDPGLILGAYVSCRESRAALERVAPGLPVTIDAHLFFQKPR